MKPRTSTEIIRRYILKSITNHPGEIARMTVKEFNITRQAVSRHLKKLMDEGVLIATGNTRARRYALKPLVDKILTFPIEGDLAEDKIWRQEFEPKLINLNKNVLDICYYGFTEMVNNVVDHSEGSILFISITQNVGHVQLLIKDDGIGIFNKLKSELGLDDSRHAILELSKGKLTTDPEHHTGEGIFFTSRMFDNFIIKSGSLYFSHFGKGDGGDWLLTDEEEHKGTLVKLRISMDSNRIMAEVFSRFTTEKSAYGFTKTIVPVALARYGEENLISRSQAKRLLARFDRFEEVLLDFEGIDMIGNAFADEIFRVFAKKHPNVHIVGVNHNEGIKMVIEKALAA